MFEPAFRNMDDVPMSKDSETPPPPGGQFLVYQTKDLKKLPRPKKLKPPKP